MDSSRVRAVLVHGRQVTFNQNALLHPIFTLFVGDWRQRHTERDTDRQTVRTKTQTGRDEKTEEGRRG